MKQVPISKKIETIKKVNAYRASYGVSLNEALKETGIPPANYYRWSKKFQNDELNDDSIEIHTYPSQASVKVPALGTLMPKHVPPIDIKEISDESDEQNEQCFIIVTKRKNINSILKGLSL